MTVERKLYDLWGDSRSAAAADARDVVRAPSLPPAAAGDRPAARSAWPRRAIRGFDWLQRRAQGVFEFSASPDCLLRLALVRAERAVHLADGTRIDAGDPIAALHLWNEHLPVIPDSGPSFAWVNRIRRQMRGSLAAIAAYAEAAPEMRQVAACRARIAFAAHGRRRTMIQVGARFGFERVAPGPPGAGRSVHDFLENFWLWGLLWTFNPRSLAHQSFLRERDDYWISRATLRRRYGRDSFCRPGASRGPESELNHGDTESTAFSASPP